MRYKVYDMVKKEYIADSSLILKPDGSLATNYYGDEISLPNCIALFFPTDSELYYIDDVGGIHDSGCGWAPDGSNCGECSNISCKMCSVWEGMTGFYLQEG